jgi:hypothetical protein
MVQPYAEYLLGKGPRPQVAERPQAASNGRSENRIFFRNWNSLGAKPFFLCL